MLRDRRLLHRDARTAPTISKAARRTAPLHAVCSRVLPELKFEEGRSLPVLVAEAPVETAQPREAV
jgi:hypothetical protein